MRKISDYINSQSFPVAMLLGNTLLSVVILSCIAMTYILSPAVGFLAFFGEDNPDIVNWRFLFALGVAVTVGAWKYLAFKFKPHENPVKA